MDPNKRLSIPTSSAVSTWGTTSSAVDTSGSTTSGSLSMTSWFGSSPSSSAGTGTWNTEGNDKAGNLPPKDAISWFGWKSRPRANSEGGSGNLKQRKQEIANWLNSQESGGSWLTQGRVRRASSKDIEEAMIGGLTKADLYMPPI